MTVRVLFLLVWGLIATSCFTRSSQRADVKFVESYVASIVKGNISTEDIVNRSYLMKYSDIQGKKYADVVDVFHEWILSQSALTEVDVTLYNGKQYSDFGDCDLSKGVTGTVVIVSSRDEKRPILIQEKRIKSLLPICKGEEVRWW